MCIHCLNWICIQLRTKSLFFSSRPLMSAMEPAILNVKLQIIPNVWECCSCANLAYLLLVHLGLICMKSEDKLKFARIHPSWHLLYSFKCDQYQLMEPHPCSMSNCKWKKILYLCSSIKLGLFSAFIHVGWLCIQCRAKSEAASLSFSPLQLMSARDLAAGP